VWDSACGVTAVIGRHLLAVGWKRLELQQVEHQAAAARRLRDEYGGFAYVGLRRAGSEVRPESSARQAMIEVAREFSPHLLCAALIFEGRGFAATIHRSFITAIHLACGISFPHRVFRQASAAAGWLDEQLAGDATLGASALQRALGDLQARASHDDGAAPDQFQPSR
jgi:hypothetical protein